MKNLITLVFIFSSFGLFSQEYQPMLDENSTWYIAQSWDEYLCNYSKLGSYKFEIGGDTVINNQTYKYFNKQQLFSANNENSIELCWPAKVSDKIEKYTGAYLREDIEQKKVFIYADDIYEGDYGFQGNEYLLYDFSLSVGDTIKSAYHNNAIVTRIDTFRAENGEKRCFFKTNFGNGYRQQFGGDRGLFGPLFDYVPGYSFSTVCYLHQNQPIIFDCAGVIVKNKHLSKNFDEILLINFSSNQITLTPLVNDLRLKIINIDGRLIYQSTLQSNERVTSLALNNGIYLITCYDPKGNAFYTKKISLIQ